MRYGIERFYKEDRENLYSIERLGLRLGLMVSFRLMLRVRARVWVRVRVRICRQT